MNMAERRLQRDEHWMHHALEQARAAELVDEVPVGAVLVVNNALVAAAHNENRRLNDPSAHAEILTLRRGGAELHNFRLEQCTLYVTLEPCAMCLSALVHARVQRVVYGAADPKAGACGGWLDLAYELRAQHRLELTDGVLARECGQILAEFFAARRG
jgi:tRNA(adenine34) deaminase